MAGAGALTVGSLFSGIGGLDLGLERAGLRVVWQAEVDPYCSKVLARHWPEVPNLGDVRKIDWESDHELLHVDLVCGGFPCQPVSGAGKKEGRADERWLWPEFTRAVSGLGPHLVLVENVPGILSRGFGDVLGDLAALGYHVGWDCLPASAIGAPHRRARIFVLGWRGPHPVGYPHGERRQEQRRALTVLPEAPWLTQPQHSGWWAAEPGVGRMAHGIPARVDRLRGLGNAVVPQVAEVLGRRIMEAFR